MRRGRMFVCRAMLACVVSTVVATCIFANTAHPVRIPLAFEPNRGQADQSADFLAHASGGDILIQKNGAVLSGSSPRTRAGIFFVDSLAAPPRAESPTDGFANYYTSQDSRRWLAHIPFFSRVRYAGIYPAIDAVFYGSAGRLEYDFDVAPGGRPADIRFKIDADKVSLAPDGSLDIQSDQQTWRLHSPIAYQLHSGTRVAVRAAYRLSSSHIVSLALGPYDASSALVIDPVVESSFFLPVNTIDSVAAMQLDPSQDLIIAGSSGNKVGIIKLNSAGTSVLYSTQIASTNPTSGSTPVSLAIDSQGDAYVAGNTSDQNFPLTSTALGSCSTFCNTGFVLKLAIDGSLVYSTLLGAGQELARSVAVDSTGYAYVAGGATDSGLQTVNAFEPSPVCATCENGFFAKLNPQGTGFVFASYFAGSGGSAYDTFATSIALDPAGNILLAGETNTDPPLVNPWQSTVGGLFLAKFAPDGKTLLFSSRFGSSFPFGSTTPGPDALTGMGVGTDGTVYLVGYTQSQDFPFALNSVAHQVLPNGYADGWEDIFAIAVDPSLTKFTYAVDLGVGYPYSMALDAQNDLYVSGSSSIGLPPLQNSVVSDVSTDGFFLELGPSGNPLQVSQFGGHDYPDGPTTLAAGSSGDIYLAGAGSLSFGTVMPVSFFNFPLQADPILVGLGIGNSSGSLFTIVSPANAPQISLTTTGPFLTLRNPGSADLHIASMSLGGALSRQWGNCGAIVPAGTSCILTVSNSGNLADVGTVTINSDAQPSSQTFNITIPAPARNPIGDQLYAQDTSFNYPPQMQGTTTAPKSMTIWNVGTADAIINSINTMGSLSETDNCNTDALSGAILAPGGSCIVQISLTPDGTQPQLDVTYDGNKTEQGYGFYLFGDISGNATQLLLSAQAVNFGTQQVGGVALPRLIVATNTGDTSFPAPSVSIAGDPQFAITANTCTGTLASDQSCEIAVQFVPNISSTPTATLTVSGQTVSLTAVGKFGSAVQVSPLELDFSSLGTPVGLTASLPLTLSNTSSSAVAIANISFSLPDYAESDNCQGQVPANGSCTMQIQFTPQQLGTRDAAVTIMFSGGVTGQVVTLTGTGGFPITVQPNSLDFGSSTALGTMSAPEFVELGNGGSSIQHYTATITGEFAIVPAQGSCPNPIPSFTGCGLSVAFEPSTAGLQQGTLTIAYPGVTVPTVVTLTGSAGTVGLNLVPNVLALGSVAVGSTSQLPPGFQIFNNGTSSVAVSSYALSGANPGDFQIIQPCATIAAGGACDPFIYFAPTAEGPRTATLTIVSNAQNGPQAVSLSGIGVAPLMSAPSSLNFTTTLVGFRQEQTFTVSNPGNASLTVSTIAVTGANAADFLAPPGQCAAIAGGTGCEVHVFFTPTATGLRSASVTVSGNAAQSPLTVALTGTGVTALINAPASLAFGSVTVGTSAQQPLNVSNSGTVSLALTNLAIGGPNASDFQAVIGSCGTIAINATCGIQITFTPLGVGTRSATLTIGGDATNSPQTVALGGTGLGSVIAVPPSLFFASQSVGLSAPQSLTITNTGNASLTITSIAVSGSNAGDFQAVIGSCGTIAANASCAVQVSFDPAAAGGRSATLMIGSNAVNGSQMVALSGTALSASFTVEPTSAGGSSATVASGGSATYNLSVTSSPGFSGTVQFACTGAPQGAACSVQPSSVTLSGSQSTNLVVTVTTTTAAAAAVLAAPLWLAAGCLPLFWNRKNWRLALVGAMLFACCLTLSCGGGPQSESTGTGSNGGGSNPSGASTPAGTYTLTVTATAAGQTQAMPLTLTVQ